MPDGKLERKTVHVAAAVPYAEEKELSLLVFLGSPTEGINI